MLFAPTTTVHSFFLSYQQHVPSLFFSPFWASAHPFPKNLLVKDAQGEEPASWFRAAGLWQGERLSCK